MKTNRVDMNSNSINNTVLCLDPIAEDRVSLQGIFRRADWSLCPNSSLQLTSSPTLESTLGVLERDQIPVLLCACDLRPDVWKLVLDHLGNLPNPPYLIVTSRMADERLWAEALNLGAWDVLAKPFDSGEVTRTVSHAWLRWKHRQHPQALGCVA